MKAHVERESLTRRDSLVSDARLIILARGVRAFGYGMLGVLLGVALNRAGLQPAAIGILVTVSLAGDFCATYLIGLHADRWGRRRTLAVLALLMAATGAIFAVTHLYPLLLIAAFFGTLGTSASETAPFLPIEQAMLPQAAGGRNRTLLFAHYNLVASFAGAAGALAAGLPDVLSHAGVPQDWSVSALFGLYALLGLLAGVLALRLSEMVEASGVLLREHIAAGRRRLVPPLGSSRAIVLRLSGLFSVDAFAGGLVVQSLMALYFHVRFGVALGTLALLFFAANTLSALSFLAAVPIAGRIGLLNTMVFTHLPSSLFLAIVPLMPTFPLAACVLLMRQMLSQMDVPTRQAYTMALVVPEERTAAASVTSLARSAGSSTSPFVAGLLLQGPLLVLGLPFIMAGTLKGAYDLTLWRLFRHVDLPESGNSQTS